MPEKHLLSKSTFMYGVQCKKRLYLHKNHKKFGVERDELSAQQEAVFSTGTNVGELAQQLFPDGIDCTPESYFDFQPSLKKTAKAIENGKTVIYEAAFQFDRVLVALDILVKREDGWHAYEVKSTNDTKDPHVQDAALQYWVMTNSGLDIKTINVLHFDREYIKRGELDIEKLFTWDDITDVVLELQPQIAYQIKANKAVLQEPNVPEVSIGGHCSNPYSCDFIGHCWKHVPEYSVFNLTRGGKKAWELYENGIFKLDEIPENFPLSDSQRLQVEAEKSGGVFIDRERISSFVSNLKYPLYFLDFETIQPAIPIYDETRTYQQVIFQYSLHIQKTPDSPVEHLEYLADPKDLNLRISLIDQLISDIGETGDILVYNRAFEATRLNEVIRDFPEYADSLNPIIERIVDLAIPFQSKMYYTADMKGSYSIKKVLPALVPELSYSDLEIQEGGTASLTFLQMVNGQFQGDETATRNALLKYCELDTLAMVRILKKLERL